MRRRRIRGKSKGLSLKGTADRRSLFHCPAIASLVESRLMITKRKMRNISIPAHLVLIIGVIGVISSTLVSGINGVVSDTLMFAGVVFTTMGTAGLAIELLGKRVMVVLESPVSDFKFSKEIALFFSLSMVVVFGIFFHDLLLIAIPVTVMFLFALAFNGGIGGRKLSERLPFYISTFGFLIFLMALLIDSR